FAGRSILKTDPKFLPGASEAGPVQQIKISLRHFNEPDQLVDRTETRAEVERTGAFLFHLDREVLPPRYPGVLGIGFDFGKIPEIIEALLSVFDAHTIEDVA